MAEFFAELKRRQIYRVAAAYVVVAWALAQGIAILAQVFMLPPWIAQTVISLLAIGFPVALITAWMIESKPQEAVASAVRSKSTIVDWTLCGALAVVLLFMGYQQLAPSQPTGVDAARSASLNPRTGVSLAVLPFANLSDDETQTFFSDGITEEIITALARVPDLRVVARESAAQFRGERRDLRAVGEALGATHLIEGSVRKAGARVRITARLVKADDGVNAWVNTFDRELTDVFAIQEDIATAIAGALRMPLGLAPGERLVSNRSIDPESYQQFLQARTTLRNRANQNQAGPNENRFAAAIGTLEQIVARYPSYAPAWALLSLMNTDPARKETAAREAIRLDSRSAAGYVGLAQAQNFRGNFVAGEDLLKQALALDPNEPEALDNFSNRLVTVGRIKEALSLRERLRTLEPFVPQYNNQTANFLLIDEQNEAAIAILEALPAGAPRNLSLAHAYAAEGRYKEAADTLLATPLSDRAVSRQSIEDAARLLRNAPASVPAQEALPVFTNQLAYVYAYIGAPERGLVDPERVIAEGRYLLTAQVRHLWYPEYAPVRKTERFKALMRNAKYVDYWRERGWPDLCRPVGANDFECS